MKRDILITAFIVLVIIGMAVVGNMDLEDAKQQEQNYCEMVNTGAWPNFKELDCNE